MLQNQSFEYSILEEQLSASENELMVLESFNALNEAEEDTKDGKGFGEKAKEFFIKIIKAIKEAVKKFMTFFVDAYNKLFSRFNNIKKYIAQANLNGTVEKDQEEKVFVLLSGGVDLGKLDTANVDVKKKEEELYQLQSLLNAEKSDKSVIWKESTLKDKSSIVNAVRNSSTSMKEIKSTAKTIKTNSSNADGSAKTGTQAAAKGDKELVNQKKAEIKINNKCIALARKYASMSIASNNEVLGKAYKVAKILNSGSKASAKNAKQAVKDQNKAADKKAKAMNA
ncbi:hypothetical protein [Staphylococcus phage vB_StaM_SA1]|nr:hypothetical protein [Staphylococcus phage vB_StaM_SA1]